MADPIFQLLHLQHRARDAADVAELSFAMVNETHTLTPYRQAALWERGRGVTAVSGVAVPEPNAPFSLWLERVCRRLAETKVPGGPLERSVLPEREAEDWGEWLATSALWLPFASGQGALLISRDDPWSEGETAMLGELAHTYGHALAALRRPSLLAEWRQLLAAKRRWLIGAAVLAVIIALFPVPLTVLAPADVVAANPAVIRAPLEGVIDTIRIRPNDRVVEGQALFDLDDTTLKGKVEVAEKSLATAEAELRQYAQQAVFDPAAKPKLAVAAGRRDEQAAELAYLTHMMERIRVKAPRAGIAVLDDPSGWTGRPVSVGEKVLELAEERDTEIEAWLAPGDSIELATGASLTMFLNVAPLSPVHAMIRSVAYEASPRPDGTVAYRVRARIVDGDDKPRLGLKGTARMSGDRVPLIYWLLRRPIAAARTWAGL